MRIRAMVAILVCCFLSLSLIAQETPDLLSKYPKTLKAVLTPARCASNPPDYLRELLSCENPIIGQALRIGPAAAVDDFYWVYANNLRRYNQEHSPEMNRYRAPLVRAHKGLLNIFYLDKPKAMGQGQEEIQSAADIEWSLHYAATNPHFCPNDDEAGYSHDDLIDLLRLYVKTGSAPSNIDMPPDIYREKIAEPAIQSFIADMKVAETGMTTKEKKYFRQVMVRFIVEHF